MKRQKVWVGQKRRRSGKKKKRRRTMKKKRRRRRKMLKVVVLTDVVDRSTQRPETKHRQSKLGGFLDSTQKEKKTRGTLGARTQKSNADQTNLEIMLSLNTRSMQKRAQQRPGFIHEFQINYARQREGQRDRDRDREGNK
jgi:hypothetical protein